MKPQAYKITDKLTTFKEYTAAWHHIVIPLNCVPDVDPGGWGAIPVEATLGESTWHTSMFPLGKDQPYFLPIKKPILKQENLKVGDIVTVTYFTTRTSAF